MKKQKFELSHDIIAEKIWQRLPERDKQLRQIQRSLSQRYEDYRSGRGSLLGKAELRSWEIYLPLLDLAEEQRQYIQDSADAIDAAQRAERERLEKEKEQIARNRRLQKRITWGLSILGIIIIALLLYSLWANREASKQSQLAIDNKKEADSLLTVAVAADSIARQNAEQARLERNRAAEATLRARSLTEVAKQDSIRVAGLLRSLGMTARELNVRHGAFLASESRNAFENNRYSLSFRLAQLALQKDENNQSAQDILLQVQPYLSDLQLDSVLAMTPLDSSQYWGLELAGSPFELLNMATLKTDGIAENSFQPTSTRLSPKKRFLAYMLKKENGSSFSLRDLQNNRNVAINGVRADAVTRSDFSTDERYLALRDNQQPWPGLFVWDLNGQQLVYALAEGVEDYRFSPKNNYLAVLINAEKSAQLQVWDLVKQEQVLLVDNIPYTRGGRFSYLNSYRFDPCDQYFAALSQTASSTDLQVWDLNSGQLVQRIRNIAYSSNDRYQYRFSFENSFRFSPDCSELAVLVQGDQYIRVELWKPAASEAHHALNGLALDQRSRTNYNYQDGYIFSPDGRFFVVMTDVGGNRQLQLRELSTFSVVEYFPYPATFSFSADSRFVAVTENGQLIVWDLTELKQLRTFSNITTSRFSLDGQLLLVENNEQELQVWDLNEGTMLLEKERIETYQFSPEEKYLATYRSTGAGRGQLEVLARPLTQPFLSLNIDKPNFGFNAANLLAVQHPANVITLYDLPTGEEVRRVFHESDIVAFSLPAGSPYLISRSENGVLKITNTQIRSEEILQYYDGSLPELTDEALRSRYGITE